MAEQGVKRRRTGAIALVLMGTAAAGIGGAAMFGGRDCDPNLPGEQACTSSSGSSSSSSRSGFYSGSSWGSGGGSSSNSSSVSRGGFGGSASSHSSGS